MPLATWRDCPKRLAFLLLQNRSVEDMGHLVLSKKIFQLFFFKFLPKTSKDLCAVMFLLFHIFLFFFSCLFWFPLNPPILPCSKPCPGMWPLKKAMQVLYEHCWRAKQTLPQMLCMWLRRRRRLRCRNTNWIFLITHFLLGWFKELRVDVDLQS